MTIAYRELFYLGRGDIRLYARDYAGGADRPTVLCLPGLTRNSADFEDLACHLAPRFRVLAPDLRGRGRSARDADWHNYQPAIYLADALALLDAESVSRAVVIGTSLGGILGLMLTLTARHRIAGLVLNDVGPEIDPRGAARIREYVGRSAPILNWQEATAQLRSIYGPSWPDLSADRWEALARRTYRALPSGIPELDYDPQIGEALRQAPADATDLWPLWRALGSIPTLAIRGALSDILSVQTLARMKREKPDLTTLEVSNRGHVPLLDEPEVLRSIDRFLEQLG